MSRPAAALVATLVAAWLAPAVVAAQPVRPPADDVHLRGRLDEVAAMAQAAVHQCQQLDAGCQDIWCQVNPAFDARVAEWPEAQAVAVSCVQYRPTRAASGRARPARST